MAVTISPAPSSALVTHGRARIRRVLERMRLSEELAPLLFSRRKSLADSWDRRAYDRFQHRIPIVLTPVEFDGETVEFLDGVMAAIPAMTRDLTLRGVGFQHHQPLCGDHALIDCELLVRESVRLLVSLRWTNCRDQLEYSSGGRFVGLVALPG